MKFVAVLAVFFLTVSPVVDAEKDQNPEHAAVGQSFYLPDTDIYDPKLGGVQIFKSIDDNCYKWEKQQVTTSDRTIFEDINSFYKTVSSDSSISVKLIGKYTMGATLNVKTKSMSSGEVDIKGTSLNVHTYTKIKYLDQNCIKDSDRKLKDDVINVFDSLPLNISNPWLEQSWQHYDSFLKRFGSHFLIKTYLGALIRQWTFSKASSLYTDEQLKIRACLDFAGPTDVGKLNVSACSDVTKDDATNVTHLETSNNMEILGGSDKTRNQFLNSRSQEDLNQLLSEGRSMPMPIRYEYIAIWDILMMKFYDNSTRYAKAMNLMHYYVGLKDFGCSYLKDGNKNLRMFINVNDSTQSLPLFECRLINKGCHSDSDCHLGGAGTVTYCYGNSCYEYMKPMFGSKAKYVVARTKEKESHKEGLNLSCHYKSPFKARCTYDYFSPEVIWNGNDRVSRLKANEASASTLAHTEL